MQSYPAGTARSDWLKGGCTWASGARLLTPDIGTRYYRRMAKSDLLQGTLDLASFARWSWARCTASGFRIVSSRSRGAFSWWVQARFFPALHRLAEKGWIEGEWTELENGRRVKVYSLTRSGRGQLAQEKRNWQRVFTAMNQVLTEDA
jgi:PadR family transcriptional regulator PadR